MKRFWFVVLLSLITFGSTFSQNRLAPSDVKLAKEHLQQARAYEVWNDPRAESEYNKAIAAQKGVYPTAWKELSFFLARRLRFGEAAKALRTAMKQSPGSRHAENLKRLHALERGAELKSRSEKNEVLLVDELLDLVNLVDRFGVKDDAVPYGEKVASLYPGSSKALIALADLIRSTQRDRAQELFNRAVQLEPQSWEVYSKRGWFYRWNLGTFADAERDFRKAIKLSGGRDSRAWQGLGDVLALQGHRKDAIEAYKTYLRVRKDAASYYDSEIKKQIKELEEHAEGSSVKTSP